MDEKSFKTKVLPLSSKLMDQCIRILGNKDDAKDVVQDLFLKLWLNRKALPKINNLESYAYTIARNACYDRLKAKKNTIDVESISYKEHSGYEIPMEGNNDKASLIQNSLLKLNLMQQKVFLMRDVECMEFDEISNLLGTSEVNVRMLLSRARKKLREIISVHQKRDF